MTFYGVEYPSGQFKSPVLAVLLPSFFFPLHLLTGREWDTRKSLMQDKHNLATIKTWMCYQHCSYFDNSQHSTVPATEKKLTIFQPKPGHTCLFKSDCVLILWLLSMSIYTTQNYTHTLFWISFLCFKNIFNRTPSAKVKRTSVKFLSQAGPATKISSPWNFNGS